MGKLIFVLGGARAGKSAFAETLASELSQDVLFVATAEPLDYEMQQRIQAHKRRRPKAWRTLEAPREVASAINALLGGSRVVLLDCLTLLVSNLLEGAEEVSQAEGEKLEERVLVEVRAILQLCQDTPATFIMVSNEVGMGLVPPYPLGRLYRDLLGKANQVLARQAHQVFLIVAGIPVELKSLGSKL